MRKLATSQKYYRYKYSRYYDQTNITAKYPRYYDYLTCNNLNIWILMRKLATAQKLILIKIFSLLRPNHGNKPQKYDHLTKITLNFVYKCENWQQRINIY